MKTLLILCLMLVFAIPANATQYQYIDLGRGEGVAINDLGWITGCRYSEDGSFHPFVWMPTTGFKDLLIEGTGLGRDINNNGEIIGYGTLGGIYWSVLDDTWRYFNGTDGGVAPLAINDVGQIVGYVKYPGPVYDSVLWNSLDSPQILDDFGGEASWAYDINENGVVVGELKKNSSNNLAYMWTPDVGTQTLAGLGHVSTAQSINDLGQIAGSYFTIGESHDFYIWQDGIIKYLSNGVDVSVSRINNHGMVVGRLVTPDGNNHHAFYWTAEEGIVDLTPDNPYECSAVDVNENGYITGIIYDAEGHNNIALWKPIQTSFHVGGKVTLQNFVGDVTKVPVALELRKHADATTTSTLNLSVDGSYSIADVAPADYDFSFKASHWLRKTASNITVAADITDLNVSLTNGDVNGDNKVDLKDLALLLKALDAKPTSARWNPNADLDGNGKINLQDMKIICDNLGKKGDL